MRQYRRVIGVLLEHYEDVHFPLLVLVLRMLRVCPALLRFDCSHLPDASTCRCVSNESIGPFNEIEPDSRSDVPSTTVAYHARSHSRFALRRIVHCARIHRVLRDGNSNSNDQRHRDHDSQHHPIAQRHNRRETTSRHAGGDPRQCELETAYRDAGGRQAPTSCDQGHKRDRPHEAQHDMGHETDYDERRRPTRNSRMSKRRADCGERKSNASKPPPHGDEGAGRRRGGETARHDRRCNDTAGCWGSHRQRRGHAPKASGPPSSTQVPRGSACSPPLGRGS